MEGQQFIIELFGQISQELERVLGGYLKHLLEREVKSAAWLDSLREQTKDSASDSAPLP